ncbi:hypothetical protein D3C75_668080 [compost metagenome]
MPEAGFLHQVDHIPHFLMGTKPLLRQINPGNPLIRLIRPAHHQPGFLHAGNHHIQGGRSNSHLLRQFLLALPVPLRKGAQKRRLPGINLSPRQIRGNRLMMQPGYPAEYSVHMVHLINIHLFQLLSSAHLFSRLIVIVRHLRFFVNAGKHTPTCTNHYVMSYVIQFIVPFRVLSPSLRRSLTNRSHPTTT